MPIEVDLNQQEAEVLNNRHWLTPAVRGDRKLDAIRAKNRAKYLAERAAKHPKFNKRASHDFNPNHDPQTGEFSEGGGSNSETRAGKVRDVLSKLREAERKSKAIPTTEYDFSPQRVELRNRITDAVYNRGIENRKHDKVATIITGLPASGKSTLAKPIVNQGALEVDPDLAKVMLPEYQNGLGAASVHEESSLITKKVLARAIQNGDNFVWPRVDSPEKVVNDIKNLQKLGYTVNVQHLEVPIKDVMHSAINRFMKTGRYVPLHVIRQFGDTPRKTFELAKGVANSAQMFKRAPGGGVERVY